MNRTKSLHGPSEPLLKFSEGRSEVVQLFIGTYPKQTCPCSTRGSLVP